MKPNQWREDLSTLVKRIEETHPYPFGRRSRPDFHSAAAALRKDVPSLTDAQIVVRLMQLVASLKDGHTTLRPVDPNGFNLWYSLRFYWFSDGLFITAAGPREKALIGAQVLQIADWTAEDAARLVSHLQGADNEFGERERIQYLSNATALHALGIAPTPGSLALTVRLLDGSTKTVNLTPSQTTFANDAWMYWGEMYGPPELEMLSSLQYLPSDEFRKNHASLPLHTRCRIPFFSTALEEQHSVFMQFNFVQNWRDEKFSDFHQALFSWIDRNPVERFILDIRYNSGGNGGLLIPFVHQLIKRDGLNRPGHLYVLVGRKTFSAGVNLIGHLAAHTQAFFVGEPAGAALNHFGDAVTYLLPNSGLELQVSRLYHQMSTSDDKARYVPIQYPAVFHSSQYFSSQDPALEAVLGLKPRSIPDLLWEQGRDAAVKAYQEQAKAFVDVDWWAPFTEVQMNDMGYRLLEAARVEDAAGAFRLNAQRFPDSWNAWDSLAEAHLKLGQTDLAREFYAKSLSIHPGNANARDFLTRFRPG